MVYLSKWSKVEKISEDTFKDLEAIRKTLVNYGTKNLPTELQPTIEKLKDKTLTYQGIIAVSTKFLRVTLEHIIKK